MLLMNHDWQPSYLHCLPVCPIGLNATTAIRKKRYSSKIPNSLPHPIPRAHFTVEAHPYMMLQQLPLDAPDLPDLR